MTNSVLHSQHQQFHDTLPRALTCIPTHRWAGCIPQTQRPEFTIDTWRPQSYEPLSSFFPGNFLRHWWQKKKTQLFRKLKKRNHKKLGILFFGKMRRTQPNTFEVSTTQKVFPERPLPLSSSCHKEGLMLKSNRQMTSQRLSLSSLHLSWLPSPVFPLLVRERVSQTEDRWCNWPTLVFFPLSFTAIKFILLG